MHQQKDDKNNYSNKIGVRYNNLNNAKPSARNYNDYKNKYFSDEYQDYMENDISDRGSIEDPSSFNEGMMSGNDDRHSDYRHKDRVREYERNSRKDPKKSRPEQKYGPKVSHSQVTHYRPKASEENEIEVSKEYMLNAKKFKSKRPSTELRLKPSSSKKYYSENHKKGNFKPKKKFVKNMNLKRPKRVIEEDSYEEKIRHNFESDPNDESYYKPQNVYKNTSELEDALEESREIDGLPKDILEDIEDLESYEESKGFRNLMQDATESEGDLRISPESEDFDDEHFQVSYAHGCVKKIGEDMNFLHSQHLRVCQGVQEVFDDMEEEIKNLSDWKKNALVKINNYKIVIKELMSQLEEVKVEKEAEVKGIESKLEQVREEYKAHLMQYNDANEEWDK